MCDPLLKKKKEIATELGILANTLSMIQKYYDSNQEQQTIDLQRKWFWTAKHPNVEVALFQWFQTARDKNTPFIWTLVGYKA